MRPGYAELTRGYRFMLPMVAYGELEQGALMDGWGRAKRLRLAGFLDRVTLLPVTKITANHWASLRFECRRRELAILTMTPGSPPPLWNWAARWCPTTGFTCGCGTPFRSCRCYPC